MGLTALMRLHRLSALPRLMTMNWTCGVDVLIPATKRHALFYGSSVGLIISQRSDTLVRGEGPGGMGVLLQTRTAIQRLTFR